MPEHLTKLKMIPQYHLIPSSYSNFPISLYKYFLGLICSKQHPIKDHT